jgi:hypothetical protein
VAGSVADSVPASVCAGWSYSGGLSHVSFFLEGPGLNITVWSLVDFLRVFVNFLILSSSLLINTSNSATKAFFNGVFHFVVYDNFNIRRYKRKAQK